MLGRMYGKFDSRKQNSKGWTKSAKRHDEERQDVQDFDEEMHDAHSGGICMNHRSGTYGCDQCYPEDYVEGFPEDLSRIPNTLYNGQEVAGFDFQD